MLQEAVDKRSDSPLLGEFLVEHELITEDQLQFALDRQQETGRMLGQSLVELGLLDEAEVIQALGKHLGVIYVSLENYRIDQATTNLISAEMARRFQVLPLFRIDQRITLAMLNPLDLVAIDAVSRATRLKVEPVVCTREDLKKAIGTYYRSGISTQDNRPPAGDVTTSVETSETEVAPVPTDTGTLLHDILREAAEAKANPVHVSRQGAKGGVAFRREGRLERVRELTNSEIQSLFEQVSSRTRTSIKGAPGLHAELFEAKVADHVRTIRASVLRGPGGESLVLEILAPVGNEVATPAAWLEAVNGAIESNEPLLVVLNESGGGAAAHKLLYALGASLAESGRAVASLETPVLSQVPGIRQVDALALALEDWPTAVLQLMTQDPDVVMALPVYTSNQMRALWPALARSRAVLMGTHYPSLRECFRSVDVGGALGYWIAAGKVAAMDVRVVRRLCESCRVDRPAAEWAPRAQALLTAYDLESAYHALGCDHCSGSGYRGYELIATEIWEREVLLALLKDDPQAWRDLTDQEGTSTLREAALKKVTGGAVSPDDMDWLLE